MGLFHPRKPFRRVNCAKRNLYRLLFTEKVALGRQAGPGPGLGPRPGAEAHDGPSERPPAAVLLLVLGTLMTAALGALLTCRARAARSRRRAHPRLALDADYLVNGMYL
ncbi:hypothetical protein RR46_05049 [Papilio xuthus]|uniref:Uncharacterized protein n=1 Tax=Papilio xuthus TaxID=66420 RepID=A0A194PVY7_PAPXU|nr:hypothetical protein RR46_05049 [Papilio xuthus]